MGEKLLGYFYENTLVRTAVPRTHWVAGTAGYGGACEICFRRQPVGRKRFRKSRFRVSKFRICCRADGVAIATSGTNCLTICRMPMAVSFLPCRSSERWDDHGLRRGRVRRTWTPKDILYYSSSTTAALRLSRAFHCSSNHCSSKTEAPRRPLSSSPPAAVTAHCPVARASSRPRGLPHRARARAGSRRPACRKRCAGSSSPPARWFETRAMSLLVRPCQTRVAT